MNTHDDAGALAARWLAGRLTRRQALGRLAALGLSLPAASAFLAACASGSGGGAAVSSKGKLTVGIIQEPTVLDPTVDATASISLLLRDNVYEGLVRLDPNLKIVPGLARSWDVSSDGTTLTFHLNSGVSYHDGTPLTAQDVVYSWTRAADISTKPVNPHVDYWGPMQSVSAVDDHTVQVRLKQYSDNFLFHMATGAAAIMSQRSEATNATSPVGTGAFKFGSWNKGADLTLTRNDAYWGPKAKLNTVVFRFITDANAMNNALIAGDVDAIGQVGGPEQLATFKSDSRFSVLEGSPVGKVIVSINNAQAALRDARVRRAIQVAINRQDWISGISAGHAVPIGSHAVPNAGEPYYVDETGVSPHDPAMAKQLLSAAGYAGGLDLRLAQITDFPYAVRGTDILLSELKDAGITLRVDQMTFQRWLGQVITGPQDYDLTIINHAEERDIGNYGNPKYYWHYDNPQVKSWLAQADAEPDAGKRQALYAQVQRQLAADAVNGYVMSGKTLAVIRANLKNYPAASLSSALYLRDTYFA
jgi:peptide/nickel transport system substrate-binding protein